VTSLRCLIWAASALLPCLANAALVDQPLPPEQFSACVQGLAEQVASAGKPLTREDFERIAAAGKYDDRVRQSMLVQAGEPTFWWDELAGTTDNDRVQDGLKVLAREGDALRKIEARFGIPKEIIVAIYGIETNYGPAAGRIPVLDAALSLACLRPCPPGTGKPGGPATCRSRERAFAAVRLLRDNRVRTDDFVGSWAAAFGRTQFVPDTLEMLGVDFDGDGVVDVVGSERDAWASTANHLKTRGGWIAGAPVWIEVAIPADQQAAFAARGESIRLPNRAKKASEWAAQGWKALGPNGESVPLQVAGDAEVYPFLPVGLPGPAFLVTRNFNTLLRYNSAERYAMEVSLLAHKLAGGRDFATPWPTDDPGLTRAQVKEFQQWLVQKGYTKVVPDGVQGRNTREAIAAEFTARGMPPAKRVGQRTMKLLMQP
jgi:membrane-bound lytic murein transglycosylase B